MRNSELGTVLEFLRSYYILDLLDVLIVAFLFYRLYLIIRGTRAIQMFLGLGVLFLFSSLAQSFGLTLLDRIIVSLQTVWLIGFIIIFQPELRRALTYLGQTRYLRRFLAESRPEMVDEILLAVSRLQKAGLGAILVLQRNTGLKTHVETGTLIDAKIKATLLETIFTPPTPLHDGAVILQHDRIVAAGCILPLSRNEHLAYTLGTRHRAALGISEESDALAIVVSEENRQLSVAEEGRLRRRLSLEDLETKLLEIYGQPENLPNLADEELGGEDATSERPDHRNL
ncbi:MAG TPA: diadenylate cyclase CdaA [Candidatus Krumholzibacteria bacterium]|nr:diadenylate cyclase CdaA [Candidatus Krumholzibacteria bacterium]